MTQRVEAEVSFRFRGSLARRGRTRAVDKTVKVSTDRGAPKRTVRVGDELWSAAIARGDVSMILRQALEDYVDPGAVHRRAVDGLLREGLMPDEERADRVAGLLLRYVMPGAVLRDYDRASDPLRGPAPDQSA